MIDNLHKYKISGHVNHGVQVHLVYKATSKCLAQNSGLDIYLLCSSTLKHSVGYKLIKTYTECQNKNRLW